MTTTFVTGGSGFVGGALVRRLIRRGDEVMALARGEASAGRCAGLGASVVIADLLDEPTLAEAMADCDVVYHVAGANTLCPRHPDALYRINVGGPVAVIRAAARAGVPRVVVTSSVAGIGADPGVVADEATPSSGLFPSHYARSKHEGERAALAEGERLGVEVVAVLPASVQGPGRTAGSARLFEYARRKRNPVIVSTRVSIVDVDDCAAGHLAAAARGVGGERYILSGAIVDLHRLVELVAAITGQARRPLTVPRWAAIGVGLPLARVAALVRPDGPLCVEVVRTLARDHRYDGTRATRELGITYTPVEDTVERLITWLAAPRQAF